MFQKPVYKTNNGLFDLNDRETINTICKYAKFDVSPVFQHFVDKLTLYNWISLYVSSDKNLLFVENNFENIKTLFEEVKKIENKKTMKQY